MWKIFKKQWRFFLVLMFVTYLLAFIYTSFESERYEAKSKILILQKQNDEVDPYVLSSASTYLGLILSELIKTSYFREGVFKKDSNINKDYFKGDFFWTEGEKWSGVVLSNLISDTGIIEVVVRHENKIQAISLLDATVSFLSDVHKDFHGRGDKIELKIIDVSDVKKTSPNPLKNFAVSNIIFLIISIYYIQSRKIKSDV